jgi:tetratricopeptide (TPR) repeat protein
MSIPSVPQFEREIGQRMNRGDLAGAAAAAAGCRAAWPSHPAGWLLGSITALLADDKQSALDLVEERLRIDPHDVQCLVQKAECLLALGDREKAFAAADEAAASAPDVPVVLDSIGEFCGEAGDYRRALAVYDRAVAATPREPNIRIKRAVVHRFLGHLDHSASDYRAVLAELPTSAKALKGLAELHRQTRERNSVAAMQGALAAAPEGSVDAAILHFGLAKSYEDMGDHTANWRHLAAGNAIERARLQYDPQTDRAVMDTLIAAFPDLEAVRPDATGERPIFIVGVPRTGTTLVDRILGSNSQVHSAGELTAMPETIDILVRRSSGPDSPEWRGHAALLGGLEGAAIAGVYLERVRTRRGERPRFTDKQLTNILSCPLIFRAFPNASIVHLTRHPLAACYAIYRTRFNGTYPFAYSLDEIADFYIGYRRVMAHWRRVLPGRILDLAYEDVVTAQEPATRRLLEYVGLPFEEACLEFHLNESPVITTSSVQVRHPLYDSSLEAWKHHAAQLAPVRARLEAAGISCD